MAQSFSPRESPTLKKYRELLGVTATASSSELKKAYHQRAFLYHPDRNSDLSAPDHFQKIKEAYEALSDPAAIESLTRDHFKEHLFDVCIEGMRISFGAFFGYRVFISGTEVMSREQRIGEDPGPDLPTAGTDVYIEEDRSILDDPAFDSIEVVYAGRFSSEDEDRLLSQGRTTMHEHLPWVLLNNKGILEFLDGNYLRALKCYEDLNGRIQNNIIFMYREALCHILLAFQNPQKTFWGNRKPNKSGISKGVQLLRKCIRIGESRPVGRQQCLVIRKLLADTLEKVGHKRTALKIWKEIHKSHPKSIEAALKSGNKAEASALLKKKKARIPSHSVHRALLKGRSIEQ
jgi:tetratricopeptide (TPR) repeat protein